MARVLLMVSDLLLGSRVREAIKAGGHEIVSVSSKESVDQALAAGPVVLLLADLSPRGADPLAASVLALLGELKKGALAQVPVVGYFSHVDVPTMQRAQEAGVQALPRSAFFADLPALIGRHTG